MSNRQKKKLIQEGVSRLKRDPAWDPSRFQRADPLKQLRELDQASKTSDAYAVSCPGCAEVRDTSGDTTSLCEQHLQEALGF